jgi:hypothetical protein
MNKSILVAAILALPLVANAKKSIMPLSAESGAAMANKVVVVTRHEKPSFVAMTAGKAGFGLFGAAAMISAGNKIVAENEIADPADILEHELVPLVAKHYGFRLKDGPSPVVKPTKPKDIAKTQADGDYILDLQSIGWQFAYYPTEWAHYWTAYSVHVQLFERGSGKLLSDVFCNANNNKHASPPSHDALLADRAQLLKDAEASHAWFCVQTLGKEQFMLPAGEITPIPAAFADPLAAFAASHPADSKSTN